MGQSDSRSLSKIAEWDDLSRGKQDARGSSGSEQGVLVIGKRDLNERDSGRGQVLGQCADGKRRHGSPGIGYATRQALGVGQGPHVEQKLKKKSRSHQTSLSIPEPCCYCHSDYLQGEISQHQRNDLRRISTSSISTRRRAETKESRLLEELDLMTSKQAIRDKRRTIVRKSRGVRTNDQDRQPIRVDHTNKPQQQTSGPEEFNLARQYKDKRAKTDLLDEMKIMKHRVSCSPIGHNSHMKQNHMKLSEGDLKSGHGDQSEPSQQEQQLVSPLAQQAPVKIMLPTKAAVNELDNSEKLTTRARTIVCDVTETETRTCECNGTTNTADSGFVHATNNVVEANNARSADDNQAQVATCASTAGEISIDVEGKSVQKPAACQAVAAEGNVQGTVRETTEREEELLTSEERAKGDSATNDSGRQCAPTTDSEQSTIDSVPTAERRKEKNKSNQQLVASGKKSRLADVLEEPVVCDTTTTTTTTSTNTTSTRRLAWSELAIKYGRMTRKGQMLVPPEMMVGSGEEVVPAPLAPPGARVRSRTSRIKNSCFCHIVCAIMQTLFPICGAFKDYSLPGDLFADLAAGFTVAILHIPQGMAYGLLSGVEPIHGLYVSFIPVLIMSFMSKSRHVSYGTFAIISMLLVNTIQQVRTVLDEKQSRMFGAAALAGLQVNSTGPALVITDNHRPAMHDPLESAQKNLLLKTLISSSQSATQIDDLETKNYLTDRASAMLASVDGTEQVIATSPLTYISPSNIEILSCVCIVCGLVHITMSLMRLGILSLMFSDQLISSFTTAGGVHVLTSQLPGLLDLHLAPIQGELFKCMRIWWQFTQTLVYEGFNQTTGLLSLASIAFLLILKELVEPRLRARFKRLTCLPSELILMAIVISCSSYFKFDTNYQVKIVGEVPSGLPEPKVPRLELVPYVFKDAISIALITFAMNLSIAQVYAKKFRYELNANQELFALGSANIISSFFSCFPCASSLSRSSIQSNLNVKSQLCSLFSCFIVVTIICYFAHILHDLPKSTLSCIIVVALKGILMQLRDLYDNWRLSKLDALVWILTFVSVLIFGVTYGLIIGIIASIFMIFLRLLTPHHSILARLPGTDIFVDKNAFAECEEIEHVKIFRFNSALCYLNRTRLRSMIEKLLPGVYPPTGFRAICAQLHSPSCAHPFYESTNTNTNTNTTASNLTRVNYLIIDCSALSYCDYSGATTLFELVDDLEARKVAVYLAACPLKLIDMLERIQGPKNIVGHNVYPTISDALGQISYLKRIVVMPTMATFKEKRNRKGGGSEGSLTDSSLSRVSDPSRQQAFIGCEGREAVSAVEQQQDDKRTSILFVPNKGG